MDKSLEVKTIEELLAELKRLKENLADIQDIHAFTFGKTTVHIGAEQAQNMAEEYDEDCKRFNAQIAAVENALKAKGYAAV